MTRGVRLLLGVLLLVGAAILYLVPFAVIARHADGSVDYVVPIGLVIAMGCGGIGFLITGLIDLDGSDTELEELLDSIPYANDPPPAATDSGQQALRVDQNASIEEKMRAREASVAKARSEGKL